LLVLRCLAALNKVSSTQLTSFFGRLQKIDSVGQARVNSLKYARAASAHNSLTESCIETIWHEPGGKPYRFPEKSARHPFNIRSIHNASLLADTTATTIILSTP
jgi:hypothetical protein